MKKFLITLLFLFQASIIFSQNALFKKGQKDLNLSLNLGGDIAKTVGYDMQTTFPYLNLSFHYGVSDAISIGAFMGYGKYDANTEVSRISTWVTSYGKEGTVSQFTMGVRAMYHFDLIKDVDTYGGAVYAFHNAKETLEPDVRNSYFNAVVKKTSFGIFLGGRYMFSKNTGAFAEIGYKTTSLALGIHTKL